MGIPIPAATMIAVGMIGGIGSSLAYAAYHYAERLGEELKPPDLLPAPPWVGLPIPRFFYTKPQLIDKLREEARG